MSLLIELQKDGAPLLLDAVRDVDAVFVIGPERGKQIQECAVYVVFSPGTTGGAVAIETAPEAGYAGQWALLERVGWKAPDRVHYIGIPGVHLAVRVRVTEKILGGTVSVYGVAKT
jgi:hypothetical protein